MAIIKTPYLIDANIFMEASRRYYSFDIALPFWKALEQYAAEGKVISIDRVYDEIMRGNDRLKEWADSDFKRFFCSTQDKDILSNYMELSIWAQSELHYTQNAKDVFMEITNADIWIIAYAKHHKCTIVTSEILEKEGKIQIPKVCEDFKIPCCDTFTMLKQLGFTF